MSKPRGNLRKHSIINNCHSTVNNMKNMSMFHYASLLSNVRCDITVDNNSKLWYNKPLLKNLSMTVRVKNQ